MSVSSIEFNIEMQAVLQVRCGVFSSLHCSKTYHICWEGGLRQCCHAFYNISPGTLHVTRCHSFRRSADRSVTEQGMKRAFRNRVLMQSCPRKLAQLTAQVACAGNTSTFSSARLLSDATRALPAGERLFGSAWQLAVPL